MTPKKAHFCFFLAFFLIVNIQLFSIEELYRRQENHIAIDLEGNALIQRMEIVSPSLLSFLYKQHWEEYESNKIVQENFLDETNKGYFLLFGFQPERESYQVYGYYDREEGFRRKLKAKVVNIARPTKEKNIWEIDIKQVTEEDALLPFFEFVLDGKVFESMFLKAIEGEQILHTEKITKFILPHRSEISYPDRKELEKLNWKVDFGGGNYMRAYLNVRENSIILHEEIKVSEENPRLLFENGEDILDQLRKYADFTIRYYPPDSHYQANSVSKPLNYKEDWSRTWSTTISRKFFYPFSYNDVIEVEPNAELDFNFGAFLGWKWHWKKIKWPIYKPSIKWFKTYIEVNPTVHIGLNAIAHKRIEERWSMNIIKSTKPFSFWVSTIPVTIFLEANIDLGTEANAKAQVGLETGIILSSSNQLGAQWNKDEQEWILIKDSSVSKDFDGIKINAGTEASLTCEIILGLSAFVYNVAGPYIELIPYMRGSLSLQPNASNEINWGIFGGFKAEGGIKMSGWLKKYIGNTELLKREFLCMEEPVKIGTYSLKK